MKKILFPTDYSPASGAALRYAVSLARHSQAVLLVAYVEPPSQPPLGEVEHPTPSDEEQSELAALLNQATTDAERPLSFEVRRLHGDPGAEIVRLAEQEQADLIVMATAGRTGWRRMLMGSVAEAIVRQAGCPVLTLKEPRAHKSAVGPVPPAPREDDTGPQAAVTFADPAEEIAAAGRSSGLVLLQQAVDARATDVHLHPVDEAIEVRLRIDGRLEHHVRLPEEVGQPLVKQLKVMADLDISDPFHPQEARVNLPRDLDGYEVRITAVHVVGGESVALRLLQRNRLLRPLDTLGLSHASLERIQQMLHAGRGEGVVLVTGPANSGKTTTAYSMVHAIDDGHRNIVTIEDPPEYRIPSFRQVAADPKHNITLTSGLRTLLRMDPDIVLVGEIRDVEAADIAMRAASSGKFVFTTLHTRDVASTVTALRDLHIDNRSLAGNLTGIVSQRLVRRLCQHCRRETDLDEATAEAFDAEGLERPARMYTAVGCPECRHLGYSERIGIFEVVFPNCEIRAAIEQGISEDELRSLIRAAGTLSLRGDGLTKVRDGMTTLDELHAMTWAKLPL